MATKMKIILGILGLTSITMSDSNVQKILKAGNDQFTAKMSSEVIKSQLGKSCVLSAFSVLSPLAQLALASVGPSHDELLTAIGMPNDNMTKEAFAESTVRLRSVKGVELKQATKLYVRNGFTLNDEFAAVSKDIFDSELQNIDFTKNQKAADEINAWVEDQTNKRIKNLVDPNTLQPSTAAVLVNAIYFKGKWKLPFEKDSTLDREFFVTNDKKINISMMHQSDVFKYGESDELGAKILEMPYEGDETSFVVVLPNQYDGIDSLIEKFKDPSTFSKAYGTLSYADVHVTLPKFKIETTTDLKKVLSKIKVEKLFIENLARLDNLIKGEDNLYISDAVQKAFIEVNEEGAEAAAANKFIISIESSVDTNWYKFDADHPFLFFLMERDNILFNGVYRA